MAIEIAVPKLGLTMEEAVLVAWKAAPGARVRQEEIVLVLETDKVTFEMPSPGEGLLHPLVAAGSRIAVGEVVGYLAVDEAELARLAAEKPAAAVRLEAAAAARPTAAAATPPAPPSGRIKASPAARAIARAHGLELAGIAGSGPGGRIVRADVLRALEQPRPAPTAPAPAAAAGGPVLTALEEIPITGVRRAIFRNMHASLSTQAQITLHTEAAAEALLRLRQKRKEAGAPVSYNALFVQAIARALRRHPRINASVEGETIRVWREIHVGVAMDFGKGLLVPKVRHADAKTLEEIEAELQRLAEAGRAGRLTLDELSLGTFTLTNLGAWGIDRFTPIVNPPESAILGVGRIEEKPVAVAGEVRIEARTTLSLTFDHRIIDGAAGAAFLQTVCRFVEEPALML
ncbi:MAG: dihydrolipoamide acetyltransferase family protein [Desulfobacterales bacterium]